jgi:hypothetical protein
MQALAKPLHFTWPDETTFVDAPQPRAIGDVLVDAIHMELREYKIGYLFKEKMAKLQKTTLAQVSKPSGKLQHYSGLDFLIEVNWQNWRMASPEQRLAIIDHELCHCGVDYTEDGKKPILVPHDCEEFGAIVTRWGIWKRDIHQFATALANAPQFDLFAKTHD